ncbi:MAG TPA: ABC transporter substrate-binding protein [Gemmatimonadaceae bacterium]
MPRYYRARAITVIHSPDESLQVERHAWPMTPHARHAAIPLFALLLGACAPGSVRTPAPTAASCEVLSRDSIYPSPSHSRGTTPDANGPLTIALTDPVDLSHAPWPRNDSERLLFAQLYEGLVRVDCAGQVVAGLARSWSSDASGRQWTFVLRDGASFQSGNPVTASDVIESWRASASARRGTAAGEIIAAVAGGARARDDGTLVVTLPDSEPSPLFFAANELAVARRGHGTPGPDGTTTYHATVDAAATTPSGPSRITLVSSSGAMPRIVFRVTAASDARDLLDDGVDLLLTESPSVAQYAATQPARTVTALPFSRTYVLLLPERADPMPSGSGDPVHDGLAFRRALATAVHADARGAEPPFWWSSSTATAQPAIAYRRHDGVDRGRRRGRIGTGTHERIVYQRDDRAARDLAERLVALAAPTPIASSSAPVPAADSAATPTLASVAPEMVAAGREWSAAGLPAPDFVRALKSGEASAYIVALPHRVSSPSLAMRVLLAEAPWLADATGPASVVDPARSTDPVSAVDPARATDTASLSDTARATGPPGAPDHASTPHYARVIVPLVDTRLALVARKGVATIAVAWDGTLLITAPATAKAEPTP